MANGVLDLYERHFADRPRCTRDLFLLDDIVESLGALRDDLAVAAVWPEHRPCAEGAAVLIRALATCRSERAAIIASAEAFSPQERLDLLAEVANGLIHCCGLHLDGKPRITLRPELVRRLARAVKDARDRLLGLRVTPELAKRASRDAGVLAGILGSLESEARAVAELRASASVDEVWHALLRRTATVVEAARRAERAAELGDACDELVELVLQLRSALPDGPPFDGAFRGACDELYGLAARYAEASRRRARAP